MGNEIIKINPKEFGLKEKQANEIQQGLNVVISERELLIKEFETVSKLELTKENLSKFKELRLRIVKNRTQGIGNWFKVSKEYFLRGGQFCDAINRKEIQVNTSMEEVLMEGEKHFENLEKQRLEDLQNKRVVELSKYVEDAFERNLSIMENDVWDAYLTTKKKEFNDRIESEKQAEQERIAKEKAEAERIKAQEIENAKLKAEAEAREKKLEKERIEREKLEAAKEQERAKERAEMEAKLKAEAKAKAKIEVELQAKKEAEKQVEINRLKELEKEKQEAEKQSKAPIKKQLNIWIDGFSLGKPISENSTTILIEDKFESFRNWAKIEVEKL